MPSVLLGNPFASGANVVIAGNPYSGELRPQGGILIKWISSGGNCYYGFSGGGPPLSGVVLSITSGGLTLSGGCASGMLDGMCLAPGESYFIPAIAITKTGPTSGQFNLFAWADPSASGIGRLFFEVY